MSTVYRTLGKLANIVGVYLRLIHCKTLIYYLKEKQDMSSNRQIHDLRDNEIRNTYIDRNVSINLRQLCQIKKKKKPTVL